MAAQGLALQSTFSAVSRAAWERALAQSLAPERLEAALRRSAEDGLAFNTLYTRADWPAGRSGLPGLMPFTRGRLSAGKARAAWDIRAVVDHPEIAAAKALLAAERAGGAESLALRVDLSPASVRAARAEGPWGLRLFSLSDLEALFGDAEPLPLALDAGALSLPLGLALVAWAEKRKARLRAALHCDPLSTLAASGSLAGGLESALATLGALARFAASLDMDVAAVGIDTRVYHLAGASEAQEIALALATGAQYLRALEAVGLALEEALPQFRFVFAADSRFFRSLCKLRAFRLCWARLAEACGAAGGLRGACLWAETSFRDLSRRDPHVNIVRGVAGCFAAALGQADAITVRPFDEAYGVPSLFARRLARNTSHVLAEEGGLARVLDPAGGAWALESMTEAMAERAWVLFQDLERAGGMAKALMSGKVAALLAETAKRRADAVAAGALPLTGVTLFPDPDEAEPEPQRIDWARMAREEDARRPPPLSPAQAKRLRPDADDRMEAARDALRDGASFESVSLALAGDGRATMPPLPQARLAAPFERAAPGARAS